MAQGSLRARLLLRVRMMMFLLNSMCDLRLVPAQIAIADGRGNFPIRLCVARHFFDRIHIQVVQRIVCHVSFSFLKKLSPSCKGIALLKHLLHDHNTFALTTILSADYLRAVGKRTGFRCPLG
jgi:hypothetical protein